VIRKGAEGGGRAFGEFGFLGGGKLIDEVKVVRTWKKERLDLKKISFGFFGH
jgi:hypothetical protein